MNELQMMQMLIGSLFGLSLYVRMWRHSMSVFIMLASGTLSLFLYQVSPDVAMVCFSIASIFVTFRGAMKPKGERIWV